MVSFRHAFATLSSRLNPGHPNAWFNPSSHYCMTVGHTAELIVKKQVLYFKALRARCEYGRAQDGVGREGGLVAGRVSYGHVDGV